MPLPNKALEPPRLAAPAGRIVYTPSVATQTRTVTRSSAPRLSASYVTAQRDQVNAPATVNGELVPFSATVADLVSRLKSAGPAAWAAFVALGANPSQEALDVLRDVAANPDWRYRRCAIEAISLHPLGRSAEAVVCRALLDQSPYVVRTACNSASALGLSEAHDTILRLISAESAETREVALRALSSLWHAEDFAPVFRAFQKDPKKSVRNRAAWALIENVSPSTWPRVRQL